jgi:hypothetical protein
MKMRGSYVLYMMLGIVHVCLEIKLALLDVDMFRGVTAGGPESQGSGVILERYRWLDEYRAWMQLCEV